MVIHPAYDVLQDVGEEDQKADDETQPGAEATIVVACAAPARDAVFVKVVVALTGRGVTQDGRNFA